LNLLERKKPEYKTVEPNLPCALCGVMVALACKPEVMGSNPSGGKSCIKLLPTAKTSNQNTVV